MSEIFLFLKVLIGRLYSKIKHLKISLKKQTIYSYALKCSLKSDMTPNLYKISKPILFLGGEVFWISKTFQKTKKLESHLSFFEKI